MSEPEQIGLIIPRVQPVRIVIPGKPGTYQKGVSRDGFAYDKKGYATWRDYARGRAAEICEGMTVWDGPVILTLIIEMLPPLSMSRTKLEAALAGLIRPLVKDCDNVAKAVQDSCLTGIVIRDDRQIVTLHVEKWFARNAQVELIVTPWTGRRP